jgi:hypothetical protein
MSKNRVSSSISRHGGVDQQSTEPQLTSSGNGGQYSNYIGSTIVLWPVVSAIRKFTDGNIFPKQW